jgi:2-dehydro-3-deoxygluconokinase
MVMQKPYDLVSFGDAMVSMVASDHARLDQANSLELAMAGAELNVAANVSALGYKTAWVSKLVDVWSGHFIKFRGQGRGVDFSHVKFVPFDGKGTVRNSLCFIEVGIGPRPSKQVYDRGYSPLSFVQPGEFDWNNILGQTKWFHTTGIAAALSENIANEIITALKTAKQLHVKTSFDLNYRSTLWDVASARKVMLQIIPYVDVLIGNEEDFEKMLGIKAEGSTTGYSKIDPNTYKGVALKVTEMYPNLEVVATTLRDAKTGLLNDWQTVMLYRGTYYISQKYNNLEIQDRTGGGDSFASAVITGMLEERDPDYIISFSAAYSALCHGFNGDWNWATRAEAEQVMKGANARVIR